MVRRKYKLFIRSHVAAAAGARGKYCTNSVETADDDLCSRAGLRNRS